MKHEILLKDIAFLYDVTELTNLPINKRIEVIHAVERLRDNLNAQFAPKPAPALADVPPAPQS